MPGEGEWEGVGVGVGVGGRITHQGSMTSMIAYAMRWVRLQQVLCGRSCSKCDARRV